VDAAGAAVVLADCAVELEPAELEAVELESFEPQPTTTVSDETHAKTDATLVYLIPLPRLLTQCVLVACGTNPASLAAMIRP
jgi:hypothetical protein